MAEALTMASVDDLPRTLGDLRLPPPGEDATAIRREVRKHVAAGHAAIAVVDDDPTGTQTVRGVPLVTDWSAAELEWGLRGAAPTFAVLTNSRSLDEDQAAAVNRVVGQRLAEAARRAGRDLRVISRSDSTLRGHFPSEPEALAAGLAAAGHPPIDAILLCPAYPEAGRVTVDDVHCVLRDERLVPVAETEFARDPAFAYASSDLARWVRERAGADATVGSIGLGDVRRGGPNRVAERLLALRGAARYVIANAVAPSDLDVLALGVQLAELRGLRLLYRTAPSFVAARAGERTPPPLGAAELATTGGRGLLVVGSYTELTSAQLREARARHDLAMVTLDADALLHADATGRASAVARAAAALRAALGARDAALVTSRRPVHRAHRSASRRASATVADALVDVVAAVAADTPLQWLVAKGGITSHDVAVRALGARRATVLGQLFPGKISVWELDARSRSPGLRYVVFPGNVGNVHALAHTLDRLKDRR